MILKKFFLLSFCCLLVFITGCAENQGISDSKLANACKAAAEVLLPEGQRIDKLKNFTASPSPEGPDFRHITIHTIMIDGWLEAEYDYECVFQEGSGLFKTAKNAAIHQVLIDGQIYGKAGNEILGTPQEHIRLNEAVRKVLYEN